MSFFTRQEWAILLTLAGVQFMHVVDFMIIMPLGPQLMRLLDISTKQFSLLVSAYTLSAGSIGFIAAFLIDRFDRKKALIFSMVGFVTGTMLCSISQSYHALLAARILTGAFGGIMGALTLSIVADNIILKKRASAMGIVMGAFSLASVLGVPTGLYLSTLWSWQAPFYMLGCVGLVLISSVFTFLPTMTKHITKERLSPLKVISQVVADINMVKALVLTMLIMLSVFMVVPFISPYMVTNVGFSEVDLTYIYLAGGGVTIITSPAVGRIADKFGKKIVFSIAALFTLIPIYFITNMQVTPISRVLLITTLFFISSNARMVPFMAIITSVTRPHIRGAFMSINTSVQNMSAGIAAFVAGSIIVQPAKMAPMQNYEIVGAIAMVITVLVILWVWQIHPVKDDVAK